MATILRTMGRMARRTGKATTHERAHADIQLDARLGWAMPRLLAVAINDTMNVIMIDRMNGITIDA